MDPVILVGRRAGQPERDRNWRFSRSRWEQLGWPIVEGHHDEGELYSMAAASNLAAKQAGDWEVCLWAGADFVVGDLEQATRAVEMALRTGRLTFAHDFNTLLTEEETSRVIATGEIRSDEERHPNTFSGVLAVPRQLWDAVGGFDERFVGWGWEDIAFWSACWAMAGGFERVLGDIYHLAHPSAGEHPHYKENMILGKRYLEAKTRRGAMRAILAER